MASVPDFQLSTYATAREDKKCPITENDANWINLVCSLAKFMFTCRDARRDYQVMRAYLSVQQNLLVDGLAIADDPVVRPLPDGIVTSKQHHRLSQYLRNLVEPDGKVKQAHLDGLIEAYASQPNPDGAEENATMSQLDSLLVFFRYMLWSIDLTKEMSINSGANTCDQWMPSLIDMIKDQPPTALPGANTSQLANAFLAVYHFRLVVGFGSKSRLNLGVILDFPSLVQATRRTHLCKKDPFKHFGGTFPLLSAYFAFLPHSRFQILDILDGDTKLAASAWPWLLHCEYFLQPDPSAKLVGNSEYRSILVEDWNIDRKLLTVIHNQSSFLTRRKRERERSSFSQPPPAAGSAESSNRLRRRFGLSSASRNGSPS